MTKDLFVPDFHNIVDAANNKRPKRLPLYEHIISPVVMEKVLGNKFAQLEYGDKSDRKEFFTQYCRFFKEMQYDTVSFEYCITPILPQHGAIMGGRPGPIQNRKDFINYPWDQLPDLYWKAAQPQFDSLIECLPAGMKAIGGVGNGVFEISEDLVGFEYLSYMQIDDPQLFSDLYMKIGDLIATIWKRFLELYGSHFVVCRFGDDLGYKTGLLVTPEIFMKHIAPQYRRIISQIKKSQMPFLWHSCGNIFEIMDHVIDIGINAKHSNEDVIAPFDKWINLYGNRIGLFGGIDVNILCHEKPDDIYKLVLERGKKFRQFANGYAIGSGNSIPDYVPVDGYLAMIQAVHKIREQET